jgi:hypothetical protein
MTCSSSEAVTIHLKFTPLSLSSQSQIKLWRLKLYLKKCLMPLDGIQRSIWMPSGEKQQGETMALFLGPVVGGGASRKTVDAFFSHITNFISQRHSVITRGHQFWSQGCI